MWKTLNQFDLRGYPVSLPFTIIDTGKGFLASGVIQKIYYEAIFPSSEKANYEIQNLIKEKRGY